MLAGDKKIAKKQKDDVFSLLLCSAAVVANYSWPLLKLETSSLARAREKLKKVKLLFTLLCISIILLCINISDYPDDKLLLELVTHLH